MLVTWSHFWLVNICIYNYVMNFWVPWFKHIWSSFLLFRLACVKWWQPLWKCRSDSCWNCSKRRWLLLLTLRLLIILKSMLSFHFINWFSVLHSYIIPWLRWQSLMILIIECKWVFTLRSIFQWYILIWFLLWHTWGCNLF